MHIDTPRLYLRHFIFEDAIDVYEYSKNPNVGNAAAWLPHPNLEYSRIIINKFIDKKEIAIVDKNTDRVIGSIGVFNPVDKELKGKEISFSLSEKYWGLGIMKEALNFAIPYIFEKYWIDNLYCCCFKDNDKSKSVALGMGFNFIKEFLYEDIPNSEPKMVDYYTLNKNNFYHFKYDFTKEQYIEIRNKVEWKGLKDDQYNNIIRNSNYKLSIYNNNELIGMARCITDYGYLYLLCDIMIDPKYQGKGIGKKLVEHFTKYLKYQINDKYAKLYIMSLKGKEEFYNKLGYNTDAATGLTMIYDGDENGYERKED